MASGPVTTFDKSPPAGQTFAHQGKLPKLPVPPLEDTCRRYLNALRALQTDEEHEHTKKAVKEFLEDPKGGKKWQKALQEYASTKDSYIEEFWYESYLSHSDPVVLALNPFFVLENDPTPDRGTQIPRAAALIVSSLGFIHDLRAGLLQPDAVRGTPLDMDQYHRLFGTARIPTDKGCKMKVRPDANHIVVIRRGQFYWFDVLDYDNRPLLNEREVLRNLQAIVTDADKTPQSSVARGAVGVLSTENRKTWSGLRSKLSQDKHNQSLLSIVDDALFVVCLDDTEPKDLGKLCSNFLCGTYKLEGGEQVGTCTNRWYDKLQIIVCADGAAGINFEHTGVDGHTVLSRRLHRRSHAPRPVHQPLRPNPLPRPLSPYARSYKNPRGGLLSSPNVNKSPTIDRIDTTPKKLEWKMTPELRVGVRFAETRLSALICQNECQALEFEGYGKAFITSHGFSPDAFVQMAFQAAYFGLYGRFDCVYEPAMTKAFLHGRTEAIRSVQPESTDFVKMFYSEASATSKVAALRKACERHVKLTKECSQGHGQDRHLYAMYCLIQRQIAAANASGGMQDPVSMPSIFTDHGWETLGTSIISTSNCGNPALRLFGFGPVAADGYGIGYIIKEDRLSFCASSKHLQTSRLLDTLRSYLLDIQRLLVQLYKAANERPAPFIDHTGTLRDSKTGRPINGYMSDEEEDEGYSMPGYSFFDTDDLELLGQRGRTRYSDIGKVIPLAEY